VTRAFGAHQNHPRGEPPCDSHPSFARPSWR
jgi:hypothetical protein